MSAFNSDVHFLEGSDRCKYDNRNDSNGLVREEGIKGVFVTNAMVYAESPVEQWSLARLQVTESICMRIT